MLPQLTRLVSIDPELNSEASSLLPTFPMWDYAKGPVHKEGRTAEPWQSLEDTLSQGNHTQRMQAGPLGSQCCRDTKEEGISHLPV